MQKNIAEKNKIKLHYISILRGIFLLVVVASFWWFYYRFWILSPLPSDELMIANFQAHRDDFEEVVRRYRFYPHLPNKDTSFWYKEGDTLEIYKRAGIDRVIDLIPMWLPDPYLVETAILVDRIVDEPGPAPFEKYSSLEITPATTPRIDHPDTMDDSSFRKFSFRFGLIWKSYYYTPEIPKVENGEMLWPLQTVNKGAQGSTFHEHEGVATAQSSSQVFSTLNRFPATDWTSNGCIYRQIEPQWFLQLCAGRAGFT